MVMKEFGDFQLTSQGIRLEKSNIPHVLIYSDLLCLFKEALYI